MSKVFREWFDTVDKNSQEWLDFVKQQEQDDEMSAQILEDMDNELMLGAKLCMGRKYWRLCTTMAML